MCACMYLYVYGCMYEYMCVYIVYMCVICLCMCLYVYGFMYDYMCVCICACNCASIVVFHTNACLGNHV